VLDVSERRLDRKLRNADRLGARIAVIVGEEEMRKDDAVVRDLAEHSQQRVPTAELAATVARLLETPE
jgi:histidyl-tRNA synthetase